MKNSYLELYAPDGGLDAALIDFPLPAAGIYQLLVKPARGRGRGRRL